MGSPAQGYLSLLTDLGPKEAVNVIENRVDVIARINADIADWLLERRKVEELYAQGLRKLARKSIRDGGASMGIFQLPWQRIVEASESRAQTHESLAQRIEIDAEKPLRQFMTSNQQMQGMNTIQGNLASIAKSLDNAQKKADKLRDKTGKNASTRAENASSSADDAQQQWETQAPHAFEQLQILDESRVNHLRNILTQFQTHEVDSIEQNRQAAEMCLNALLNIEISDEIKTFATRLNTEPRQAAAKRRQSSASNTPRKLSSAGGGTVPPLPPPPRLTSDTSQQSLNFLSQRGQTASGVDIKETPKKQGLKSRLGTVMSRKKSTPAPPNTPAPVPGEKARKERNRASFMPFRRAESSKNYLGIGATSASGKGPETILPSDETVADSSIREADPEGRSSTWKDVEGRQKMDTGGQNGDVDHNRLSQPASQNQPSTNLLVPNQPHELSVTPPSPVQHMDAISRAEQEASAVNGENEEAVRRLKIRDQPIQEDETEAQQAMSSMANQLRLQAQSSGVSRLGGSARGRRDVRNTIFIPDPERGQDESESLAPSDQHTTTASTIGAASSAGSDAGAPVDMTSSTASPMKAPATVPEDRAVSDTTSVHSSQSLGTVVHHPEMHSPGLNSSIVETISASFSEGTVSRSFVVGEIALSYNPPSSSSFPWLESESQTVRLDNFQVLEKIAPNPSFVSSSASEKGKEKAISEEAAGEYRVSLSAIKRPVPIVAFKYQLHLDPANLSAYSPILLRPAWQIQDSQASVIVMYSLNPAFVLSSADQKPPTTTEADETAERGGDETSITLKNVVISISLDPSPEAGKASSAMMAPHTGAAFKRKQGAVVWKMPTLTVSNEEADQRQDQQQQQQQKQRLLARFVINGPRAARPGPVEARWEMAGRTGSRLGVSVLDAQDRVQNGPADGGGGGDGVAVAVANDPFADDDTTTAAAAAGAAPVWTQVHTVRSLVSGRYSAT